MDQGHKGVMDIADPINFTVNILYKESTSYYVNKFLEYREYLFFKAGYDIWVMLKRVREGNEVIQSKVRELLDNYNLTDFFKEFLSHIQYVYEVEKILG